jgi:hypothetical protein
MDYRWSIFGGRAELHWWNKLFFSVEFFFLKFLVVLEKMFTFALGIQFVKNFETEENGSL